jgi:hypothetical protein
MGMADLQLDDGGRLTLVFDELPITFVYESEPVELLWLMGDLGAIDEEDPQVLQALLQFGFFTWSANRMTIGVDEQNYHAIGYTSIPVINLDPGVLQHTLEVLLETAQVVRERLDREEYGLSEVAAGPNDAAPTHHWLAV